MRLPLFQILAILRDGPQDSAAVIDGLRDVGGPAEVPSLPAFYRHLRRAVDEGWVEIVGTEAPEEGRGRPRQVYALTGSGLEALEHRARWLERFTRLAMDGSGEGGAA